MFLELHTLCEVSKGFLVVTPKQRIRVLNPNNLEMPLLLDILSLFNFGILLTT